MTKKVPPKTKAQVQKAQPKVQAPKGRNISARGNALGNAAPEDQSPEGATHLPDGWRLLPLGKMGHWFGGGTPSKANQSFWTNGTIPWVSPKDMKTDRIRDAQDHITSEAVANSATSLVPAGSVLLVVRSGILKHTLPVAVTEREVSLNQDLKAVTPSEDILPEYLALGLKAFEREILHHCCKSGTTVQNLEMPVFLRFELPVAPPDDQRRIVAEIEKQFTRLEAGVAALRRVQANLKRYRAAVLAAACEGRLVPTEAELARAEGRPFESGQQLLARILTERRQNWQGRGKYKEPETPNVTELSHLPDGWIWATAEQLTDENRSITYGVIKLGAPIADGVHVLRSSDVRHLQLDLEGVKRIDPEIANEYQRTFLKGGEVLMTVRGTLGGVVVAPPECEGFNISREVAMLAMIEPSVAKIAAIFIGSDPLQHWLLKRAKGIAYTGINIETLKQLPIPLPPLAEQTRIVAEVERRLSVVEELEAVVTTNLQRATRLRQSILQQAFTGELLQGDHKP